MLSQQEQGILFRELIHSKGFNQKSFAKATGYPTSCISRLCKGERSIEGVGLKSIIAFTKVLNIPTTEVFCNLVGISVDTDATVHASATQASEVDLQI